MSDKAKYLNNCVSWPPADVHAPGGLCDMIDQARMITREMFVRRVDPESRKEVEVQLGYGDPLRMCNDYHVTYHYSKLHGKRVYFFKHSAIEYVFS